MTTEAISPELHTQTEFIRTLRKKIRLRYLLVFFCWFGVICGISAMICIAGNVPADFVGGVFAGVTFFGFLIVLFVLQFMLGKQERAINSDSRLMPSDAETLNAWFTSDRIYNEKMYLLERERKNLLLLGFIFFPLLIPLFILSEINYRYQIRALGLHPGSPANALCSFAKKRKDSCTLAAACILLFSLFFFLFNAMFGFTARSKVSSLNSTARYLYQTACTYQADLDYADQDYRLETTIFNLGAPERNTEFYKCLQKYFNDADRINFAIICDENGTVCGAVCANKGHEITEYDLTHFQAPDEQYQKMSSLFHKKEVVANYIAPPEE